MKKFILLFSIILSYTTINAQSWQTVFYDDFNRADGALGSNYTTSHSGGITQLDILSNEVKVASGLTAPAYWIVSYLYGINADSIRISCKFRAPNSGYGFSISARDDGVNTYSAGLTSNSDTIAIYRRDYIGNSTTLVCEKAYLDTTKTYYLEFTLKGADLSFKFVEVGMTDTITINATDNLLTGNNVNLSTYYYLPNRSVYFDNFRIESYSNSTGIDNIEKNTYSIFPNPASDIITLNINDESNTDLTLNIYNGISALVKSAILKQNNRQINIGDLRNGIYIVSIKSKDFTESQRLIIQR